MDIPAKDALQAAYNDAPDMVRSFITSDEFANVFTNMRDTHRIHLDEAALLASALSGVFLGLIPMDAFPGVLKTILTKNPAVYEAILKDTEEHLFVAFKNRLVDKTSTPTMSTPSVNKLEVPVREKPVDVAVSSAPRYPTNDPYREPVE